MDLRPCSPHESAWMKKTTGIPKPMRRRMEPVKFAVISETGLRPFPAPQAMSASTANSGSVWSQASSARARPCETMNCIASAPQAIRKAAKMMRGADQRNACQVPPEVAAAPASPAARTARMRIMKSRIHHKWAGRHKENLRRRPGAGGVCYLVRKLVPPFLPQHHHLRDDVVAERDEPARDVIRRLLGEVLRPPDLVERLERQVGRPERPLEIRDRKPDLGLVEPPHARRDHRAGHVGVQHELVDGLRVALAAARAVEARDAMDIGPEAQRLPVERMALEVLERLDLRRRRRLELLQHPARLRAVQELFGLVFVERPHRFGHGG